MELRTLRSFLAVAREGNVTRAARSLHITQPALSRQLLELERELGCELLIRESRGVTLTDAGMLLRKRAEEIVMLADRAELEIRSPEADVEGDVWIGSGESRAIESVAKVATRLAERFPGIHPRLHSGNRDDVVERVDKGLLDFGIVFGEEPPTRYDSLKLPWEDVWGLLVRADDPLAAQEGITIEELRDQRIIASGQSSDVASRDDPTITFFGQENFNVVATYTLLYNASLLVEQGLGVAVCFDGIVATGEGTPFAFIPFADMDRISSYLVWKRYQPLSRACEAFLRAMREECSQQE